MSEYHLLLPEQLTLSNVAEEYALLRQDIRKARNGDTIILDCGRLHLLDSAGVAMLDQFNSLCQQRELRLIEEHCSADIGKIKELFHFSAPTSKKHAPRPSFFERLGQRGYALLGHLSEGLFLISNIFYWAIVSFFNKRLRRQGEVIRQSLQIGLNALPIIGLIAFLIGFILALQSAVQLRQFGANIYVADLVAVAMVSEMGPLITAIMVAGRSGSSIAAEIATMKVSEELDALQVMGIDPLPYLMVPKFYALLLTLPLLTVLANVIGILGGMIIGVTYLNIEIIPFYHEVISVLRYKDIMIFLVKSITFSAIILFTAAYFGLKAEGGAEEVGRVTTSAVVASIFWVIVADSILGLIFYFGEPVF